MLDVSSGKSLLSVIHEYMKLVMVPALAKTQWGQVDVKQQREFTSSINSFVGFLESEQTYVHTRACIHAYLPLHSFDHVCLATSGPCNQCMVDF